MPKRRVTTTEERELRARATRLARAEQVVKDRRLDRDHFIASLVDDGARASDICEILGFTAKAVYDAAEKGRD